MTLIAPIMWKISKAFIIICSSLLIESVCRGISLYEEDEKLIHALDALNGIRLNVRETISLFIIPFR